MTACCVLLAVMLGQQPGKGQPDKAPPPLTAEQRDRLQKLVRVTQEEATRLKTMLEESQRQLARLYSEFDLNETDAEKLQ
ncbi:MAG: hypothetical protein L0Z62_03650, partial [Gemmataceae bacterium]|nr:hypothetical protein [Gemmataceae bacterium]